MRNIFSLLLLTVLSLPVIGNACDHHDSAQDHSIDDSIVAE
ncbi:hypothetical protein [Cysteiniphilum sp. QT6929]|nr:hypothetical protein [Cysteiniphilum sp. QT6929]WHN66775.1 hypothetical protein NYP54_11525 [Cysteiniphilum sp. QT6929]